MRKTQSEDDLGRLLKLIMAVCGVCIGLLIAGVLQ